MSEDDRLSALLKDSADTETPPPRPAGWWVVPVSYAATTLVLGVAYLGFGWKGLAVLGAVIFALQLGHRIGTGRWMTWDDQ